MKLNFVFFLFLFFCFVLLFFFFIYRGYKVKAWHMNFYKYQYIRKLTDLLSSTPNLKKLDLHGYRKLVKIHDSIRYLDKLKCLVIGGCLELQILPRCIVMKSLKILSLFYCERVRRFPNIPQEIANLKFLSVWLIDIIGLPPSIGNFIGLETLMIGSNFYSC